MNRGLGIAAAAAALLLSSCSRDRARPLPTGPGGQPRVEAEVLAPAPNTTVIAGRVVQVDVAARDRDGSRLAGFGFLAVRSQGRVVIDSVAVYFPSSRAAARDTFEFTVPAGYPTNTQVDVYGLAFGTGGAVQTSVPVPLVVIQCTTGTPPC